MCENYKIASIKSNYVCLKNNHQKQIITLYTKNCDQTIMICDMFSALWMLLLDTSDFVKPTNNFPVIYNLPSNNATEICGILERDDGFLTMTSTTGFDGPITEDGLALSLFQLGYTFKIHWETTKNVNISFYTSYNNLDTNRAYLMIDNNNNLTQYCGKSGCFTIQNYDYFYVKINQNAKLKMRIEIVIPECPPEPFKYGTEYLIFNYECQKYKIPILTLFQSKDDPSIVNVIVDRSLINLQKEIHKTLEILSQPWPETIVLPLQNNQLIKASDPVVLSYFNVYNMDPPTAGYYFKVRTYANTYNFLDTEVFERDYWWSMVSRGSLRDNPTLGITIKPAFRLPNKLQIEFEVEVVSDPRWKTDSRRDSFFRIVVRPGFKRYSFFNGYEFVSYANDFKEIKDIFFVNAGNTFSGTIELPEGTTTTTFSCELNAIANTSFDIENTEFFKFKKVVLRYV